MSDARQYNLMQGHGHEPFEVGNPVIFKSYLLRNLQWELAIDHWFLNYSMISKFVQAKCLKFWPSFCVT